MKKFNNFQFIWVQQSGKSIVLASVSLMILTITAIRFAMADSGSQILRLSDRSSDVFVHKLAEAKLKSNSKNTQKTTTFLPPEPGKFEIINTIKSDELTPKSVVYAEPGLFFVQNMMYEHSIAVYNRQFKQIKKISDQVNLSKFGYGDFSLDQYKGSPVEAAVSQDNKSAYISNYQMYGPEFNNPGHDTCLPSDQFDPSFVYRVNTENLAIDHVIKVGSVPKFLAVSPNNKLVLVTNWCSGDVSVIDTTTYQEIQRISVGRFPRGIAISPNSQTAYIAVMGTSDIAKINLKDYSVSWMYDVGLYPRHLVLDSTGKYLYVTLNGDDHVAKIDTETGEIINKIFTGAAPRSMVLSNDDQFLYVVNYYSHTVSKVQTENMEIIDTITVDLNPIGITYDPQTRQVWVACYTGSLVVIQD